ncbi:lysylphosphatidylglycerol synthase transmembrane domain-containing protein [Patulibacter sp. SYSU D01012]|uniref:lysylphosphatidylglycerol synthase transmembrane domain-containing protein n=1 Tax=Patulibacter sp. SYSU D01012 TaxID=2817381 RepID=UPI001B31427E
MQRQPHSAPGSEEPSDGPADRRPGTPAPAPGEDAAVPADGSGPASASAPAEPRPTDERAETLDDADRLIAAAAAPGLAPGGAPDADEAPSTHGLVKRVLLGILAFVVLIVAFRLLAPHVGFLNDTWQKVRRGDPVWLIVGVVLEGFSFLGYVWVFNATARRAGLRLPRFTSWRIVLAGVAATRLLATAGAGGIASTTFALRRHGLDARHAVSTVTAQIAIVYVWFIGLIAIAGLLAAAFGHGHAAITTIPAAIAAGVLLVAVAGRPLLRRLANATSRREGRVARVIASIPGTLDDAVHTVTTLVRERDIAILGGALWWVADAGVLWAACHAFGYAPNMIDVMMAYLLGQVANLLPIPGGLGVEAGLLGMLIAFGVPGGVAVLASLVQRLISTWLPALPGAVALAAIGKPSPDAEVVPVDDDHDPPGHRPATA